MKNKSQKKLRQESVSLESTNNVKMSGWFESVSYDPTWYKNCKHPFFKNVVSLNVCGPSEDIGYYGILTAVAHPQSNYYTLTQTFYTDSACSQEYSSFEYKNPILICRDDALFHVIPAPLNPATDNLNGFAYGVFSSASLCSQGDGEGLLEAYYIKLNYCYETDNGDVMWSSCDSNGLTEVSYSSTNGSCKGTGVPTTYTQADTCTDTDSLFWFTGSPTFVCEN